MTVPRDAYAAGLEMLARRDLTASQLRQRLASRGYGAESVAAALEALKADGSLDDARAAGAIARVEAGVRRRGRRRVEQRLAAAGITGDVAARALDEAFQALDAGEMLNAAVERRLGSGGRIDGDREFARLYRHFVSQGFERDQVLRVLRSRQGRR